MKQRILIFGAGIAGKLVAQEIDHSHRSLYQIVGYIDDTQPVGSKVYKELQVLGTRQTIPKLVHTYRINELIIAVPSVQSAVVRDIIRICEKLRIRFRIVPKLIEIIKKSKVSLEQIRSIQPEDLLGREMVTADLTMLEKFFKGRTVLVTGAAGSIGSELCKQIMQFGVQKIVCLDSSENGMYHLQHRLKKAFDKKSCIPVITNIQDNASLEHIFSTYRPDYVYHAAAYKHVPLMEVNITEAVKNNVIGSQQLVNLARKYHVQRFLFISTDKAVNPTNVMGATKRVAEYIIHDGNLHSATRFASVRFGNVLESSGSVIPLFKRQIAEGGPVTVTDRRITRFFMTVTEAVQLVLLASFYQTGGETFVLDMGEPVKILDLAKNLIRLAGATPGKDIHIRYIGLRPGEKLYEETLTDQEHMRCIKKDKIYISDETKATPVLRKNIQQLMLISQRHNSSRTLSMLKKILPNFDHRLHINKSRKN